MDWIIKRFKDLNTDELYDFLKLRTDIFVVEQNCPYPELDNKDKDQNTRHITTKAENNLTAGYLRVLGPGVNFPEPSFGRLAVARQFRNRGIGHLLVKKALSVIETQWPGKDIAISAQEHLQRFYGAHGFIAVSASYLEDGIPHIDMARQTPGRSV